MAEVTKPVKAFLRAYIVFCTIITFSYMPPVLIEAYYPTASWALVAKTVFVWITDTGSHALAGGMFCVAIAMLGILARDAYKALSRALNTRRIGPVALEDGAVPTAAAPTSTADAATPPPAQLSLTLNSKLLLLFVSISFCAQQFFLSEVVSVKRSLWQNIGAVLMYILRGLQILQLPLGAFLVIMTFARLRKRHAAERTTAQAVAPEADEKAVVKEENPEKVEV